MSLHGMKYITDVWDGIRCSADVCCRMKDFIMHILLYNSLFRYNLAYICF